ncbi:MAG: hypothetical protein NUW01_15265 [Gemmatimonadaceae bacterium]|nr:hypothetical protein [Gemmatimonadaceae bacterium]
MGARLKAFTFRALAVIGALTLLLWGGGAAARYLTRSGPMGVVRGEGEVPVAGLPVFLDRGGSAIERYVTDSAGRFFLPLEEREFRRAVWLICAPGQIPMVGSRSPGLIGPSTYGLTPYPEGPEGKGWSFYRGFGWRGPIPRECPPGRDSMGWRYPASAGKDPNAFTLVEPEWDR